MASSSAFTVGLLRACTNLSQYEIAEIAEVWEIEKTGGMVGSQDQYLCAVGGFHYLQFTGHGIKDTTINLELVKPLQNHLMLFDTHQYRLSSKSISTQLSRVKQNTKLLIRMAKMAYDGIALLDKPLEFGKLLDEAWQLKKQLSKYVSTPTIDTIYETAVKAGAIGGKLLGGGGGGFIIFLVEPEKQKAVKEVLNNLTYVPFKFESHGSEIIYKDD